MTSFTNNKTLQPSSKYTAQQDLSFIPVWQWMEGKKDGGREGKERGGQERNGDKKERARVEIEEEKVLAEKEERKEGILKWRKERWQQQGKRA